MVIAATDACGRSAGCLPYRVEALQTRVKDENRAIKKARTGIEDLENKDELEWWFIVLGLF
jgi:lysozyme family protein